MRRTLRRNLLKAWLAWFQLLAVAEDTFWILTLRGSAVGSSSLAHFLSQGSFWDKVFQQGSVCFQLVVKEYKLSWVVLKVRVKNKSGRFSNIPSKLASILSLKIVCKRFSWLLKRAKYEQF